MHKNVKILSCLAMLERDLVIGSLSICPNLWTDRFWARSENVLDSRSDDYEMAWVKCGECEGMQ